MRSTVSPQVRVATEDDVPGLVELGWRFIKFTPYGALLGADRTGLSNALCHLLRNGGRGWVAESEGEIVGALIAQLSAPWCSPTVKIAVELAWWLDVELQNSGCGIRLLKLFEKWADENEASMVLSDLVLPGGPNLGDLVERLGYRLVERSHLKERI